MKTDKHNEIMDKTRQGILWGMNTELCFEKKKFLELITTHNLNITSSHERCEDNWQAKKKSVLGTRSSAPCIDSSVRHEGRATSVYCSQKSLTSWNQP
jgi:hypothetical protein